MKLMSCRSCGNPAPPIEKHGQVYCTICGALQEGCCEGMGQEYCPPSPSLPTKEIIDDQLCRELEEDSERNRKEQVDNNNELPGA